MANHWRAPTAAATVWNQPRAWRANSVAAKRLKVLYEDNHLLAVAKPAGVPTMGAKPGVESVADMAKAYLREKYDKPGNVYLGIVSRLDAPVTGVLLFARTSKAAGRLSDAFRTRRVEKRYLATVTGEVPPCDEPLVHYLKHDDRNARVYATHADAPDAKRAELSYKPLLTQNGRTLLEIELLTGRKHQIRVQLAKLCHPILGDEKYGSTETYAPGIALHAWRLEVEHPVRKEPLRLVSKPADRWGRWDAGQLARSISPGRGDSA
ncbi:MAG: RNA pseudouridine synthase [Planctomycetota bacterium]